MSLNFQHLRAFYAVASDRSVTRAASRLGVSQPTLSKQVKALEDRYQVKLIEGARPPLALTAAGQALFERARTLFDVSSDIEALLGETPPEHGGLIRQTLSPHTGRIHLRSTSRSQSQTPARRMSC